MAATIAAKQRRIGKRSGPLPAAQYARLQWCIGGAGWFKSWAEKSMYGGAGVAVNAVVGFVAVSRTSSTSCAVVALHHA